jgi:hypothetical protein
MAGQKVKILASSSWTAAYVYAAGIGNVDILAPVDMIHPSEYELNLDDFKRINDADFIVYGGYEVALKELMKNSSVNKDKFIKINTGYKMENIKASVNLIAAKTKTLNTAQSNLDSIADAFSAAKKLIEDHNLKGKPVICHFFQKEFISEISMMPVYIFGPSPLEAYQIKEIADKDAVLIADNLHNPIAGPLTEIKKNIRKVNLINFPGTNKTRSLIDVINYNINQIIGSN